MMRVSVNDLSGQASECGADCFSPLFDKFPHSKFKFIYMYGYLKSGGKQ